MSLAAFALAAGAPVAVAQEALLYINAAINGYSRTAATSAGFNVTEVFDEATFIAEMGSGTYDIAIYENPANFTTAGLAAGINGYVGGGGKFHFCYWNLDGSPDLQASLDVASTVDIFTAAEIHDNAGHPSWGATSSPVALAPIFDPWNDNGDNVTATPDGDIVATHTSVAGPGATVAGNGDQTICNAWEYDTKEAVRVVELLQSQMEWLLAGGVVENCLVLDGGTISDTAQTAATAAGLTPLVVTTVADFQAQIDVKPWRMVLVDVPSLDGALDSIAGDLSDYLDGNGRLIMNYWNLDANPGLQGVMGVAGATDFSSPRSMFPTAPTHPSWGAVASVAAGSDLWGDNGDVLSVDCSGPEVIGAFDSAGSGFGAIVLNNNQTIMNGHDWDSLNAAGALRLAEAQIRWLRTAEIGGGGGGGGCPSCLADCDGSGSLDFFDFLCFQNLFAAEDCCADCDDSGSLDFFDFLCFQNEFSAGCPELEYMDLGLEAPPSVMCSETMSPFSDGRADLTIVMDAPSPLGGAVTFDIGMSKRTVGLTWGTWSHGYAGPIYYTNGSTNVTMGIPGNSAFYFYTEPNPFAGFEMRVTASGGGAEIVTGPVFVSGQSGALGFGYCGGVEEILVEWVSGGGGLSDFAVGEFGIAN